MTILNKSKNLTQNNLNIEHMNALWQDPKRYERALSGIDFGIPEDAKNIRACLDLFYNGLNLYQISLELNMSYALAREYFLQAIAKLEESFNAATVA